MIINHLIHEKNKNTWSNRLRIISISIDQSLEVLKEHVKNKGLIWSNIGSQILIVLEYIK